MIDRKAGIAGLKKMFDDGSLLYLNDKPKIKILSTGIVTIDYALGIGGFARGSQYIIYGAPSSSKSMMAYTAIANVHKNDPESLCAIIDIERSATEEWLVKFGIDPKRVVIVQEETIEDAVNTSQKLIRANSFDIVLIDSLGAVQRSIDFDGKDGKGGDANTSQVGGAAKVITNWVNKLNAEMITLDKIEAAGEEVLKPVIIFINQARDDIGNMYNSMTFGGGNAIRHIATGILRVTASNAANDKLMGIINDKSVQVGTRATVTIEKNKLAPPKRQAGYYYVYQESPEYPFGIDSVFALAEITLELGIATSKGAWCEYPDLNGELQKVNGKQAYVQTLRENEELYRFLYQAVTDKLSENIKEES